MYPHGHEKRELSTINKNQHTASTFFVTKQLCNSIQAWGTTSVVIVWLSWPIYWRVKTNDKGHIEEKAKYLDGAGRIFDDEIVHWLMNICAKEWLHEQSVTLT